MKNFIRIIDIITLCVGISICISLYFPPDTFKAILYILILLPLGIFFNFLYYSFVVMSGKIEEIKKYKLHITIAIAIVLFTFGFPPIWGTYLDLVGNVNSYTLIVFLVLFLIVLPLYRLVTEYFQNK